MINVFRHFKILALMAMVAVSFTACDDDDENPNPITDPLPVGGVYVMSNGDGQVDGNVQGPNRIVTYSRFSDGTIAPLDNVLTGGDGGDFDGGEGLDPLISAYAITKTADNAFVLAVNAGSNTVSALPVNTDFSLGDPVIVGTSADGPNSIDTWEAPASMQGVNSLVLVTNISRPEYTDLGEPRHIGTLDSFWLLDDGTFQSISSVDLDNRPSCVHISPDGNYAIVASINAGAAGLDIGATDNLGTGSTAVGNQDEVVLFSLSGGAPSRLDGATSTLRGNAEERNLPSAIGSQIVTGSDGEFYVVVTEAREFRYQGLPPIFPGLQSGSVSTWRIDGNSLEPISLDVPAGSREDETGRTACWLDFNDDNSLFYVSNAIEASIATYSFNNGEVSLVDGTSAQGTGVGDIDNGPEAFAVTEGWIDLWVADGFLYQLHGLEGAVSIWDTNNSANLILVDEVNSGFIPDNNSQGIVAF